MPWTLACDALDLDDEDVVRFDHSGRTYVICRTDDGEPFCVDGLCPLDGAHLAGGLVEGTLIECPLHGGCFDLRDGTIHGDKLSDGKPAALATYAVRRVGAQVEVDLPG